MKYLFSFIFAFSLNMIYAQFNEISIGFDNCSGDLTTGDFVPPSLNGPITCGCGINGEAINLEGQNSSVNFDSAYTEIFQGNFTLSFYFLINEDVEGFVDILSVSSKCGIDSSLTIKYVSDENLIQVQMAKDIELLIEMEGRLDPLKCWHQIVIVRDDKNFSLFLDGDFADNAFVNGTIELDPSATMKFADSPCQAFGEVPFRGYIDEFRLINRVTPLTEIFESYIPFDQLITMDTTIFSGGEVNIMQEASCADQILWTPVLDIMSFDDYEPVISPSESRIYAVTYDYGICTGKDSISISVIDSELVECSNLLLPNVFTPNNDGLNDEFGISNAFIIEELKYFEIFDRWGERVFKAASKNDTWNGQFYDKKVNSNVFLVKVGYTCKGEDFIHTGSFSILR